MKIVEVSFERLKTFGNFENMKVGAVAEVEENTDPAIILNQLRIWVDEQLSNHIADNELSGLKLKRDNLLKEINGYNEKLKKMREAIKTLDTFNIQETP